MTKSLVFLPVLALSVSAIACAGPTRSTTNDPSALPGTKPPHSDDLKRSDPNTDAERSIPIPRGRRLDPARPAARTEEH